jgi:NitT/TauT family transport system substrate-binding protein
MAVWREANAGPKAVDMMDNAPALPTAAEADAASRCMIESNDERSGLQLKNRPKRSRGAGPSQLSGIWLSAAALTVGGLICSKASAQALRHVVLAVGTSVLNAGYPMDTLPLSLGYWKEEGYDVDVEPVGASLQAVQQLVAGNADLAQVNASAIVQSDVTNKLSLRVVMANGVTDWAIAVPVNSPIKSLADLKGKTIGVFSVVTTGVPLLQHSLKQMGTTMEAEGISFVPLGLGAPPVQALKRGEVDALLYWAPALTTFRNAGLELRDIVPPEWRTYPDYSLATLQRTVVADPDMVVAIARGVAKATVYAIENPECAVRLHWKRYPDTKPKGVDDATTLRIDLNTINTQLATLVDGFKLNGGKQWGATDPSGFARLQTFLQEAGITNGSLQPDSYLVDIPNFYQRVNDFDADKIRAAARACEATP